MCTNAALVDSLECYMDELVECFEDFVKKSLIVITVAVCSVIAMLMYMLKVLTERQDTAPSTVAVTTPENPIAVEAVCRKSCDSNSRSNSIQGGSQTKDVIKSNFILECCNSVPKTCTTAANTMTLQGTRQSYEERFLREMGLSNCSQGCNPNKRPAQRKRSASRLTIPSLPNCLPKHHLSAPRPCSKFISSRSSCCSMCCDDDRR